MIKWFYLIRFLRKMRTKYERYDFRIVTSNKEIVIYIDGEDDELRLNW